MELKGQCVLYQFDLTYSQLQQMAAMAFMDSITDTAYHTIIATNMHTRYHTRASIRSILIKSNLGHPGHFVLLHVSCSFIMIAFCHTTSLPLYPPMSASLFQSLFL